MAGNLNYEKLTCREIWKLKYSNVQKLKNRNFSSKQVWKTKIWMERNWKFEKNGGKFENLNIQIRRDFKNRNFLSKKVWKSKIWMERNWKIEKSGGKFENDLSNDWKDKNKEVKLCMILKCDFRFRDCVD